MTNPASSTPTTAGTGSLAPPRATPAPRTRRKHPSHGARAIALASSVVATGGLSFAMGVASHATTTGTVSGLTGTTGTTGTSASTAGGTASYTDGTYTGTEVTNKYGPVEAQVTITDHKIASVTLVESPSDGKSQRINANAAPVLEQEAVAAQSSTLDIVSGATYTTKSYVTSLQAALDQALPKAATAAPVGTGSK